MAQSDPAMPRVPAGLVGYKIRSEDWIDSYAEPKIHVLVGPPGLTQEQLDTAVRAALGALPDTYIGDDATESYVEPAIEVVCAALGLTWLTVAAQVSLDPHYEREVDYRRREP